MRREGDRVKPRAPGWESRGERSADDEREDEGELRDVMTMPDVSEFVLPPHSRSLSGSSHCGPCRPCSISTSIWYRRRFQVEGPGLA